VDAATVYLKTGVLTSHVSSRQLFSVWRKDLTGRILRIRLRWSGATHMPDTHGRIPLRLSTAPLPLNTCFDWESMACYNRHAQNGYAVVLFRSADVVER
jgi:hypothetical protein